MNTEKPYRPEAAARGLSWCGWCSRDVVPVNMTATRCPCPCGWHVHAHKPDGPKLDEGP